MAWGIKFTASNGEVLWYSVRKGYFLSKTRTRFADIRDALAIRKVMVTQYGYSKSAAKLVRLRVKPKARHPEQTSEPSRPIVCHWTRHVLQFFEHSHLPANLAAVAKPFHELAYTIARTVPSNPERTYALRKLLEAKDCAVRAALSKPT